MMFSLKARGVQRASIYWVSPTDEDIASLARVHTLLCIYTYMLHVQRQNRPEALLFIASLLCSASTLLQYKRYAAPLALPVFTLPALVGSYRAYAQAGAQSFVVRRLSLSVHHIHIGSSREGIEWHDSKQVYGTIAIVALSSLPRTGANLRLTVGGKIRRIASS